MMKKQIVWLCCLSLSLIRGFIFASEPATPDSGQIHIDYYFNRILKTATKVAHAERDIAASITVIPQDILQEASSDAVFDVVQSHVPGLYVTQWGVMGFGVAGSAAGKLSMRGTGGGANSNVLILRNGRPDFMGLMGCTIADEFSSQGIERVEIIRGPGSFLYGTNAIGGVINLIPKTRMHPGFEIHISTGLGQFGSQTYDMSHGGNISKFDYFLTLSRHETDGHREDANSHYKSNNGTLHMGYQINRSTRVDANINAADIYMYDPGQWTNPFQNNWYDIFRYGGDLNLTRQSRLGESHIKLHGNFGRHKFFDGWNSNDRTLGMMAYHNFSMMRGQTATVGLDYKRYGGEAEDASADYGKLYITEYAPYIYIQQLIQSRLILSGGLRLEHHELYGNELLPKAGIVWHPGPGIALRLSASKGFRSPSIRELYFWAPANETLNPDRLWNYELGTGFQWAQNLQLDIALFQSEGTDLIQLQAPPPRWTNSGSYVHRGYECTFTGQLKKTRINIGWSHSSLSEQVYNTPEKKLTANVRTTIKAFTLATTLLSVFDWQSAEFMGAKTILHPMEDYTIVHLSGKISVTRTVDLHVHLKNILDEKYEAMYGYPMPGRYVMTNVKFNL